MEISLTEKQIMVNIARNSIFRRFDSTIEKLLPDTNEFPILNEKVGVFVTLTIDGELRGCIGYILSEKPLYLTLADAAVEAAFSDPRFPALKRHDMNIIDIEISVLSRPFPLKSYDEIEVGKHGLIVTEGNRRGLLLPQVPVEHNLSREQYLSALCQKAGIYSEYWREKQLNLDAFTADVFSENELEIE